MEIFEGVDFEADLNQLVVLQLRTGRHCKSQDVLPGAWLKRAWDALSSENKQRLADAIHEALLNEIPQVRAEALVLLELSAPMVQTDKLLKIVQSHFHLFEGLRHTYDPPHANRARDLVRLTAALAQGPDASSLRQKLVLHPEYGSSVLNGLVRHDCEWLMQHLKEIVDPSIDQESKRIDILLFNLREEPEKIEIFVEIIAQQYPVLKTALSLSVKKNIKDQVLTDHLLIFLV